MKYIFGIILALFLGLLLAIFYRNTNQTSSSTVTIRNQKFIVEIAKTDAQHVKGLSGRKNLEKNSGMLFLFDEKSYPSFWMKGMQFPIDIIFIADDRIVTIFNNVPNPSPNTPLSELPRYIPTKPANFVFEINAGLSEKYGFQEGDLVSIKGL